MTTTLTIPVITKKYLSTSDLPANLPAAAATTKTTSWGGLRYLGRITADHSDSTEMSFDGSAVRRSAGGVEATVAAARDMAIAGWKGLGQIETQASAVLQTRAGRLYIAPVVDYGFKGEPHPLYVGGDAHDPMSARSARDSLVAIVGPEQWVDFRAPKP